MFRPSIPGTLCGLALSALVATSAITAAQAAENGLIDRKIAEVLSRDPFIPVDRISITNHGGVIVLTGAVADLHLRQRITRLVAQIPGVLSVRNSIGYVPGIDRAPAPEEQPPAAIPMS